MMKIYILNIIIIFLISLSGLVYGQISVEDNHNDSKSNLRSNSIVGLPYDSSSILPGFVTVDELEFPDGISTLNIPSLLKEDYFIGILDDLKSYIGGFNGTIWGEEDYLTIVDGVPRDINSVNPLEIEDISFLKGISAKALYGSQAVNGVILIKTKVGRRGALKVSGRLNSGVLVPKRLPSYLGSAEYMTLYNEARRNDGLTNLYGKATIYNYQSEKNPYRYPSVDYFSSQFLKRFYNRHDANVEISGGSDNSNFYANLLYTTEGSLLNFGEGKKIRNNRLRFHGHAKFKLNEILSTSIGATAIFDQNSGVNTDFWNNSSILRPNSYTPLIPVQFLNQENDDIAKTIENTSHLIDGKYLLGGSQLFEENPIASIYSSGSNNFVGREFQFTTGFDLDLNNLLTGLEFNNIIGIDYSTSFSQAFNESYAVYEPHWANFNGEDEIGSLTKYGSDSKTGIQDVSNSAYRQTLSWTGVFKYDRIIDAQNHFNAFLIFNGFNIGNSGDYHRTSNANAGLKVGYDYMNKYFLNFIISSPYSAKLPNSKRIGLSPVVSLSWDLLKESFMQDKKSINSLILSVSGGIMKSDKSITGYYLYDDYITQGDGSYFGWRDGALRQGSESKRAANPNLTFVKYKELNAGLKTTLFDHLLSIRGEYFYKKMVGGVIQNNNLFPEFFFTYFPENSFVPYVNYNDDLKTGFDFSLDLKKNIFDVDWDLGIVGVYYDSRAVKRSEVNQYQYQNREGRPLDGIWGLKSIGLFESQEDIKNSPEQIFGDVKPGDLKYEDINGDGVIDEQDEVYLGRAGWFGAAPFTFGVHLLANWRNWSILVLGNAQFGSSAMKDNDYYWVNGDDKYSTVVRNRWTPENKENATYPRLTTRSGGNNFRPSSFWMYSSNRFDLSKVQLSYFFPESLVRKLSIEELQVYLSGSNLLTVSKNKKIMETNIGSPPQLRVYNLGLSINF